MPTANRNALRILRGALHDYIDILALNRDHAFLYDAFRKKQIPGDETTRPFQHAGQLQISVHAVRWHTGQSSSCTGALQVQERRGMATLGLHIQGHREETLNARTFST